MFNRTMARQQSAVNYFGNEVSRGMMEIIASAGLPLDDLLACRAALDAVIRERLLAGGLEYIGLAFLSGERIIDEGGVYLVQVSYASGTDPGTGFPVHVIRNDLRRDRLNGADAYRIYLYMPGYILVYPSGRSVYSTDGDYDQERNLGSFGFQPIGGGVFRGSVKRSLLDRFLRNR